MTVMTIMAPGIIYVTITIPVLDMKPRCLNVTLTITTTATHTLIKQECDALDLLKIYAPKMEMYNFLMEMMKMKEL